MATKPIAAAHERRLTKVELEIVLHAAAMML